VLKDILRITEKLDLIYEHLRVIDDNVNLLNQRVLKLEQKAAKFENKKWGFKKGKFLLNIMEDYTSFENQVFNCFKKNVEIEGFFGSIFGLKFGKDCNILYNYFDGLRELDIVIKGDKRLNLGLLVSEDYNIEVQSDLCTLGDVNHKCSGTYLYSILSSDLSNNSKNSNKVYSFVNFSESGCSSIFIN